MFQKHLQDDEKLLKVVHKHWLMGAKVLAWPTVFFLASLGLLSFSHTRGMIIVVAILATSFLVWWIQKFLDYYLDAWLITNHGIIDIAWFGWFHRQSTRILYSDVEGVSYEIKGIFQTLFRIGTLTVEKVSTGSAVSLEYVWHPKSIEFVILQHMEKYLQTKNMKDSKHVQEILSALVADQMQLHAMKK